MLILTDTLTPAAGTVWLASGTAPATPGVLCRYTYGIDHRQAQTLHEILADEDQVLCEVETWQVLSKAEETCPDCAGTAAVPATGGEPEGLVDNGLVPCPSCTEGHS